MTKARTGGGEAATVVRLKYKELAKAAMVVLLPVSRAGEGAEGVRAAPGFCRWEGGAPGGSSGERVGEVGGAAGVGTSYRDRRGGRGGGGVRELKGLQWRVRKWEEEGGGGGDRKRKEVRGERMGMGSFWLPGMRGARRRGLRVERGSKLGEEEEEEVLGRVLVVALRERKVAIID